MTFMYKWFDRPRDVGEFTDKILRKGEKRVEIIVRKEEESIVIGASFIHHNLALKAGKYKIEVDGCSGSYVLGNSQENIIREMIAKYNALVKAVKVGKYLEDRGLEVLINDNPVDEVKREIEGYKQRIESKSKEYGLDLKDKDAPVIWSLP